jgi:hypothetical protein
VHIGLINCTEKKNVGMMSARHLYTGSSFTSGVSILEEICDEWYILSGLYGLLRPDARISSYDKSLESMSRNDYRSWAEGVAAHVVNIDPREVTIIAPDLYAGFLVPVLTSRGVKVERRPRVDICMQYENRWYMSCQQCGNNGPFQPVRLAAVRDAIGHPCRVEAT